MFSFANIKKTTWIKKETEKKKVNWQYYTEKFEQRAKVRQFFNRIFSAI